MMLVESLLLLWRCLLGLDAPGLSDARRHVLDLTVRFRNAGGEIS